MSDLLSWLDAVRARLTKATPGPWHRRSDDAIVRAARSLSGRTDHLTILTSTIPVADCVFRDGSTKLNENEIHNAELIAEAPTDLDRAERLLRVALHGHTSLRRCVDSITYHLNHCQSVGLTDDAKEATKVLSKWQRLLEELELP